MPFYSQWIFGSYKHNFSINPWYNLLNYHVPFLCTHVLILRFFFHRVLLINDSQIVFIAKPCLLNRSLCLNKCVASVVYWSSTRPNLPFKRRGSCIFHWRRRAWLTIWDKVKSRGTVIDWCTGREWPVNCMTVFSAWWRSNMPFQRLSRRLNYYITRWKQEVS